MSKRNNVISIAVMIFLLIITVMGSFYNPQPVKGASFAKGADVSWVPAMEAEGYVWYDKNGNKRDILDILKKDYNIDSVRIRTWVNPSNDYGNGYLNKSRSIALAKRAKNMGFKICFDFHYSDSWADPGKQNKPAAWKNLNFEQLMKQVYDYTYDVMSSLANEGIYPEWVQVGNETNNGMLWEDGRASANMKNFAWLINCGHDAVKAVSSNTKVIVHLSNGYDNSLFRWMFDGLTKNGAKFDIIGMSLYPKATDWQTMASQCSNNMRDMKSRYNKGVMLCEIGMEYSQETVAKSFISDIVGKTQSLGGEGVFYWEPQAFPNYNAGYNMGAWKSNGRPTIALEGFGYNGSMTSTPTAKPTPTNTPTPAITPSLPSANPGDLNNDGSIDSTDYSFLRRYILNIINDLPIENDMSGADLNLDGNISSTDCAILKRYILGIINKLPYVN